MLVGLRPAASFPSNAGLRGSRPSTTRADTAAAAPRPPGATAARRSFTRGARTGIVPAPQVTFRDCARPFRATRRRPSAARAPAGVSMYCSTSASRAGHQHAPGALSSRLRGRWGCPFFVQRCPKAPCLPCFDGERVAQFPLYGMGVAGSLTVRGRVRGRVGLVVLIPALPYG